MSASLFRKERHVLPCQHIRGYARSTSGSQEEVLHIAINQYIPLDNPSPQPGDITLIAAHANGIGKELYEPLWDDLHRASAQTGSFRIRGIWIADVSFQGESGVLNEHKLGNDPSWADHPRDLLHMINHFRADMPRPLFGLGHSMGGHNITNLALIHPRLLDAVILVDPVVTREGPNLASLQPMLSSTARRDVWPSRAAAAAAFGRNPFYQAWDPRVLELWIRHGLRDLPTLIHLDVEAARPAADKQATTTALAAVAAPTAAPVPAPAPPAVPVTLTTPKHLEVFTFTRPNYPARTTPSIAPTPSRTTHPDLPLPADTDNPAFPFYRPEPIALFAQLPHLRPRCLYLFADGSHLSAADQREAKLRVTGVGTGGSGGAEEGAVEWVLMQKAGHFVPFERPRETAELVEGFVGRQVARWREDEATRDREWRARSQRDKVVVDADWLYWTKALKSGTVKL